MGLALAVGILGDLKESDSEGFDVFRSYFDNVNALLAANGLSPHLEPEDSPPWGAEMFGYAGLHYLRRLAAYVDSGVNLPGPGGENSAEDERLEAYFNDVTGESRGLLKGLFRKRVRFGREFDHLIVHSDAEGFYLPLEFPNVLFGSDDQIPGGMLGSAPRLLIECDRLARILGIPPEITKDSEALWDAADSQGMGEKTWQQYGVESFTCVALREACHQSIKSGAAIVFS